MDLLLIFLTGLSTGIFMCIPMCGGLMASCVTCYKKGEHGADLSGKAIWMYLGAKLVAYTAVGALLGWLGSFFQLSIQTRMYIVLMAAVFMIILALQLLDVHPIFRRFNLTSPKFLMRLIKKESTNSSLFAPAFLGFLTAFLPCGPMQATQVIALSSGSPIYGALVMFAFGLGTSPALLSVGLLTKKLGQNLQQKFVKISGVLVLILALVVLNRGLALSGSPYSFGALKASISRAFQNDNSANQTKAIISNGDQNLKLPDTKAEVKNDVQEVTLKVYGYGYNPKTIVVKKGVKVKINVERYDYGHCSKEILIPAFNVYKILPPGTKETPGKDVIEFTPDKTGTFTFTCGMGMLQGTIVVE